MYGKNYIDMFLDNIRFKTILIRIFQKLSKTTVKQI